MLAPDIAQQADGSPDRSLILVLLAPVGEDRRAALLDEIRRTLDDVHAAVADFDALRALADKTAAELAASPAPFGAYGAQEYADFLHWLSAGHFVFLGARTYEYPRTPEGDYAAEEPTYTPEGSLGLLRDQSRPVLRRASEPAILTSRLGLHLEDAPPLTVSKATLRSRVQRRADMDFIGVRRYDAKGRPVGETRFVGLFTAEAYEVPAGALPLVRRKVEAVLAHAGHNPSAHTGKRLRYIVETYPRDELFQIAEDDLRRIATGVLHLYDRPRVRLFARTDALDRFVSVPALRSAGPLRFRDAGAGRRDAGGGLGRPRLRGGAHPVRPAAGAHLLHPSPFPRPTTCTPTNARWRRRSPRPCGPGRTASRPQPARAASRRGWWARCWPATPTPFRPATGTSTTPRRPCSTCRRSRAWARMPTCTSAPSAARTTSRPASASSSTARSSPYPWRRCCRCWRTWG